MENRVVNYKGYIISTEEGTEKGLFFRNPLQEVSFDAYYDKPKMSAWKYLHDIKNPFRRVFEILIGNGNIVKISKSGLMMCILEDLQGIFCVARFILRENTDN